jgi:hypothetical protein
LHNRDGVLTDATGVRHEFDVRRAFVKWDAALRNGGIAIQWNDGNPVTSI